VRLAAAPIIFLQACLFLSGEIRAQEKHHSDFNDVWAVLIDTLNQEQSGCDNIGVDPSIDLFSQNQKELKQIGPQEASKGIEAMNNAMLESLRSSTHGNIDVSLGASPIPAAVLREFDSNPVLSLANIHRFENGEQIGFCFGRALALHYLLLKAGVSSCDIYKIFAIGNLMFNYQIWHFHVAVLIRDAANGFVVVDPSFGQPLSVDDWMKSVEKHDIKYPRSQTRFYVTDPRKLVPSAGVYDAQTLGGPILREYFTFLGSYLLARGLK